MELFLIQIVSNFCEAQVGNECRMCRFSFNLVSEVLKFKLKVAVLTISEGNLTDVNSLNKTEVSMYKENLEKIKLEIQNRFFLTAYFS